MSGKKEPLRIGSTQWGFIGCGNLAQSLITGVLTKKLAQPHRILVSSRTPSKIKTFAKKSKIQIAPDNSALIKESDIIFIATKPQDIFPVLEELKRISLDKKIVVSLAAGVDKEILHPFLVGSRAYFRVMANTPAKIQKGVFGLCQFKGTHADYALIEHFFAAMGSVVRVKNDRDINLVTVGSASGIGFVLAIMEEFERWLLQKGWSRNFRSRNLARQVVVETFLGAAELAKYEEGESLASLKTKVVSKKGTTWAGLEVYRHHRLASSLKSGLDAALRRAEEISKGFGRDVGKVQNRRRD